jgi:choline dehydrogenase-like flavoprotein
MSINDLRTVDGSRPIETDLCLIGSGPAGWAIAEELKDSGLRILMLESGGHTVEPDTAALNEIEDIGTRLFNGRSRVLGGTSYLWNGRCMPFDDIDYEERPWLPRSGWPFGPETMVPYVNRASEHLAAGPYYNGRTRRPVPRGLVSRPSVDPALMRATWWENPASIQFGQFLTHRRNPNLWVLLRATVTHLNTDPFGRQVQSVEVADAAGRRLTVRARAFVLCAGGIENPRIMLCSNRVSPNGVGNEHDTVGRFLMDHPRDFELIARVDAGDAERFRDLFGPHVMDNERGRHDFIFGYTLSPERQRAEQLLNTAAWPYEVYSPSDPFEAVTRLAKGPRDHVLRDAVIAAAHPALLLKAVRSRRIRQRIRHKVERIGFLVSSEQVPNPDSRVQLGKVKDHLGLPISRVDWRVHELEARSQAALAQSIQSEFARLGLPAIRIADWVRNGNWKDAKFVDGCHPIGTTRMSVRPEDGVVDADCKVHGVDGLYVAGSSVFSTAGHANPTLMILALAVRLADHLRRSMSMKAASDAARTQPAFQVAV